MCDAGAQHRRGGESKGGGRKAGPEIHAADRQERPPDGGCHKRQRQAVTRRTRFRTPWRRSSNACVRSRNSGSNNTCALEVQPFNTAEQPWLAGISVSRRADVTMGVISERTTKATPMS